MELAGRGEGVQYDSLNVTGDFTLGGALDVVLQNGFSPQSGDTFNLFDFDPARRTGTFGNIRLPALATGLSWDSSNLFATGELAVVPEPASAPPGMAMAAVLPSRRMEAIMVVVCQWPHGALA